MGKIIGYTINPKKEGNYASMKVDELKTLCNEKGLEFNSKITKEELIKLLEGAE